jgi:nucleotide-binding universal stress UspA family protein
MNTSYRQVLVHVDATRAAPHRLAAALAIARNNDAPLAALYAVAPAFMELPYAPELGPSLAAELVAIDQRRRDQALRMFDELARGSRPPASWAQVNEVPIADAFAQQALYADLLVLGQHERTDAAGSGVPADFVELVLAASGRPDVVLPFTGTSAKVGDTVAIAWKPTAEASAPLSRRCPSCSGRAACTCSPGATRRSRPSVARGWTSPRGCMRTASMRPGIAAARNRSASASCCCRGCSTSAPTCW